MATKRQVTLATTAAVGLVALIACFLLLGKPQPKMNVLFVSLDTTRADRLGCYGYRPALTPTLDRLAQDGLLFEHACAPAPLTLPSHASMFTGLYPAEHGLRTNGRSRLDPAIPTLAAELKSAGYDTGAFVASFVLDSKFGLDRGFSRYDDDLAGAEPADDALHRQRDGRTVVDSALAWLRSPRSGPFFCWVHLYDPHFPYLSHEEEFGERFRDSPYDAEIAYVDRQVQRLLDHVREAGIDGQTLVVVVGDHGEGLGQHVEKTHGYTLYEATQHVPWIVRTPDRIAAGRRTYNVVSLVDLSPTVLDYLGLRVPGPVSGRSLAAALRGAGIGEIPCHAAADDPFLQNGWSPLRSITTEQWKYIRTAQPELYDLQADPRETRNLAAAEPVALARMARMLDDLEARMQPREAASVQLSAEERRALESLGYLRGRDSSPEGPPSADLPDVKEMLPYDVAAQEALDLLISGKVQEGVERLQRIVEESPAHLASRVFLGEALERQGKLEQAIAAYQQALQLKPDYPDALIHLGTARVAQGRLDDAVAAFDEALRIDPDSSTAHYNLGLALMHLGQLDEAISQFEEALRGDDGFPNAHGALGRALIQRGRRGEALEHLRQEIKSNPQSVEARLNLATLLAESDAKEADRLLREALKIAPENPQVHYNLGAFLLMHKRPGEALAPLAEAVRLMPDHPRAASELARARRLSGQSH